MNYLVLVTDMKEWKNNPLVRISLTEERLRVLQLLVDRKPINGDDMNVLCDWERDYSDAATRFADSPTFQIYISHTVKQLLAVILATTATDERQKAKLSFINAS